MTTFENFEKLDIRVGEIIEAEIFSEARKPAFKLKIDFGEKIEIKKSSAQITELYKLEELTGKQILGVINFSSKKISSICLCC